MRSSSHRRDPTRAVAIRSLAIGLAAAFPAACAPALHAPQPQLALPSTLETGENAPTRDGFDLVRWWDAFGDPQLAQLAGTALERSTTIRIALARLEQARATRALSRAGTLPSGSLTGAATESGSERAWGRGLTAPDNDSYAANFAPSWELDLFGRLSAIRQRADIDRAAASYDFYGVRLALVADVATALYQARATSIDLEIACSARDLTAALARNADVAVARGLSSGQDQARLHAEAASSAAEVLRLEGELHAARRSLLILVGTPDARTDSIVIEPRLLMPPDLPAVTPGIVLTRRPDVLSAELAVRSAVLGAKIDRLALFPRFGIQGGAGLTATGGPAAGATGLWSLAANLTLPVLDRPRLMAQFRLSEARGSEAAVRYEKAVQTAYGEAENALVRLRAGRTRSTQLETAEEQAHRAYDIAARSYRSGLTDLTTLLQTQRTWLQARSSANQGRLAVLTGAVAAIRALGGGWSAEPQQPSSTPKSDGTQP